MAHGTYIDLPIEETGLRFIFNETERCGLWKEYAGIENFTEFAVDMGAIDKLPIHERIFIYGDSPAKRKFEEKYNRYRQNNSEGYVDWYTDVCIDKLLSRKCIDTSRSIWNLMRNVNPIVLKSSYYPNESRIKDMETAESSLVAALRDNAWVPIKSGGNVEFVKPVEATKDTLADGFEYDDGNGWLTAIGFGEAAMTDEQLEEHDNQSDIEKLKKLSSKLSSDELKKAIAFMEKSKPEFPGDEDPIDREKLQRRETRKQEGMEDAPDKTRERVERNVRTSAPTPKNKKTYFKEKYTNTDEKMVCQICKEVMPFKKRDGNYYFEAVEIIDDVNKEDVAFCLALCPLCAAKYKEFVKRDPVSKEQFQNDLMMSNVTGNTQFNLKLDTLEKVKFVQKHLADVRGILKNWLTATRNSW